MKRFDVLKLFSQDENIKLLIREISNTSNNKNIFLQKITGSQKTIIAANIINKTKSNNLFVLEDLEEALYFLDDLNNIDKTIEAFLLPSSNRIKSGDNNVILERIEVLNHLNLKKKINIVTYPSAVKEKLIERKEFKKNIIQLSLGDEINLETLIKKLKKVNLEQTDFVLEPGDFSIRGFIIDVFSYSNEYPYRIVLDGDIIDEITYFKVSNQISINSLKKIDIISNIEYELNSSNKTNLFSYLPKNTNIWINNSKLLYYDKEPEDPNQYVTTKELKKILSGYRCINTGSMIEDNYSSTIIFDSSPQPSFNKNFEILINHLDEYTGKGYENIITVSSTHQMDRLKNIFNKYFHLVKLIQCDNSLRGGFIDKKNKILLYTDHQIFERHHQYRSKRMYKTENTLSIKELTNLKKGDYITHFDYGIGMFDGLRIKTANNKKQESIRIIYKNNDVLYISIHALHKIAKYKDSGAVLQLDKLGSPRWKNLKENVKKKIKVVAFDLIKLYAKRKMTKGFAFSKDTYLQNELEAAFLFQETEDQIKITKEIKNDMESSSPMDRLVCGDVGFGKTEVAIRAAFKAVADNKQVAVLVPTTILALQHNKTFQKRLADFPCTIKYLSRFISKKESSNILNELEDGLVDIIIGTHRLISEDVKFKDLGLLIVDEEQKFGVSVKDKLKTIKESVDTLTLTATPIPRTLQFSLMGSRDLSIMTTYPKNRNPIETTISIFNHELIKEVITYEVSRGGQVFFVHNRIANIQDFHIIISTMFPNLNVQFAHGKMESKRLEKTILDFINGEFDVLITTTIIENGLDIPNANTIIINNAHNFGLSDLHQMRGRVGRSNKKAFCYLMTPPFSKMKDIAIKRLNAIIGLSNLGDGFNISMKDLEIRGAGNMLGAEQSGFIENMGFSNYQKILDEAIMELKEKMFKNFSLKPEIQNGQINCSIETDLELLISNDYVSDVTERMDLYKRLSKIQKKEDVENFKKELADRFGKIPNESIDLIKSIKLRQLSEQINCQKIILKKCRMIIIFNETKKIKNLNEDILTNLIKLIQENKTNQYSIKEDENKMKLYVNDIQNIDDAIKIIQLINNPQ